MKDGAAHRQRTKATAKENAEDRETDQTVELASPPCYLHEIDPAWSGIPGGEYQPAAPPEAKPADTRGDRRKKCEPSQE